MYHEDSITRDDLEALRALPGVSADTTCTQLLGEGISVRRGYWVENFVRAEDGTLLWFSSGQWGWEQKPTPVTIERALEIAG